MSFRLTLAVAALALAVTTGAARAATPQTQNLSHAELKQMIQNAHTAEDYLTLASYFRWRQQQFTQQAHDELAFWAQRSMNISLEAAKYPRPADSSRNRYDYFTYEAQQMGRKAAYYEGLSAAISR
ncbi:MAG: hypothetical protein ABSD70_00015 [Terracidiphilus sp.]